MHANESAEGHLENAVAFPDARFNHLPTIYAWNQEIGSE
jgi:hypothetical protein